MKLSVSIVALLLTAFSNALDAETGSSSTQEVKVESPLQEVDADTPVQEVNADTPLKEASADFPPQDTTASTSAADDTTKSDDDESGELLPDLPSDFEIKPDTSLLDYLDPAIVNDPEVIAEIQEHFRKGHLVVLKDAFIPEFADIVWQDMARKDRKWESFVSVKSNGHNFFKHRAVNRSGVLKKVKKVFSHQKSREFLTMLSGRDCMNPKVTSLPSLYKRGDHSNPHTDRSSARTVTYLWQLSKDWKPEWGGAFYWNAAYYENAFQHASYNTLIMFSVHNWSVHGVTPVTKFAKGKRLTYGGWYSADLDEVPFQVLEDPIEDWYSTAESRRELTVEEGAYIVGIDLEDEEYSSLSPERRAAIADLQDKVLYETFEPEFEEAIYTLGPPEEIEDDEDDEDEEIGGYRDPGVDPSPVCVQPES